ncbi:hypothetical protein HG536_0F03680 [Torulaspora globosa]|uniref:Nucleotide exchange factor SIL1 n=1 Tax=Torulaspora globosa TaxID=48254 RepID=A0A7G3ZKK7_9SACH|nr:uncharacterized protein HG536_0F03680 [Torulaspora globosa]QLL34043.1 hypothetical protein HG536_0F03680 [Torulaspora globosa]
MARLRSSLLIGLLAGLALSTTTLSKHQDDKESTQLHIGDSQICNEFECYPKVFEASSLWQEIKPGQHLPGGLDVRMNLETGVREAKLCDDEHNAIPNIPVAIPESDSIPETSMHEFTQDFDVIRKLIDSDPESNLESVSAKLEDLMEFAHDYKHGYDIVAHEFDLLKRISCDEQMPLALRDISTIMITSCTRNNPRVVEYINKWYPDFIDQVYQRIGTLITNENRSDPHIKLLKRYLSLLDELTTESYEFTQFELDALDKAWQIPDKQIRIEVLELISKLFTVPGSDDSELRKRGLTDPVPFAQMWANNIQELIQDDEIDELHTRKFFDSLYAIKQDFSDVKIEASFLSWLSRQVDERKKQLDSGIKERDLEQDSFDKKMIESRHLVFGNPMAHKIKNWNDEL